jgi:DNA polymerase-3 subunit epsilon
MREIVLDTETTGLDPLMGDRIVEIAALELVNHIPTGNHYHVYLNPERDMPAEAFAVHGLSQEFLSDKALFADAAVEFLDFIADSPLVIHNGAFDMKFLNAELSRIRRADLPYERLIDTLVIARKRYPGAPASLDALCRRFNIDLSVRTLHGALVDCELLAAVYLELVGGRQPGLVLADESRAAENFSGSRGRQQGRLGRGAPPSVEIRPPRPHNPTPEEIERHRAFAGSALKEAIWLRGESSS